MGEITVSFTEPFYTGTVSVAGALSGRVVSIADHWYLLDLVSDRYRYVSVPALRPQMDTSAELGEQAHNREGLLRRVISTFELGAGQDWFDREGASPRRFRNSRGIDPFERWEVKLLPSSTLVETEAGGWNSLAIGEFTGGKRVVAGGANGKCLTVTPGMVESSVAALAGNVRVASNGSAVYAADSTDIWLIDAAGTGKSSFNANVNAADVLAFVKNRLIAGIGAQLWDVVTGATAAAHFTVPWSGWKWTGFAEGPRHIFGCGFAGDRGLIYSVTIKADGTGLDVPVVALELPHGELPFAVVGYVGLLVVGTSRGVRVCTIDAEGGLTMGPLVGGDGHTTHLHECRCLEPQDRFVWFGWDNTFADVTGLGRIDLSRFVEPLAPAYATDLMSGQAGMCQAVITFDNRRWFTVGTGLYVESATKVTEGWIETGIITFNMIDDKVAVFADLRHLPLPATSSVLVEAKSVDSGYSIIGNSAAANSIRPAEPFLMNHTRATGHELKVTLKRGSDLTGPVLTGVLLHAQNAPERSFTIFVPLLVHATPVLENTEYVLDVPAEVVYLRRLCEAQQLVRFQSGVVSHLVFIDDYEWVPHHSTVDGASFDGTMVVKLKSAMNTL